MTNNLKQDLLSLNKLGLIPGPNETECDFLKRSDYCLNIKNHLPEDFKENLGKDLFLKSESFAKTIKDLVKLYDISPDWIPLFYSNYKLPFWQGGCAWIYQLTENSPTSALIQLRRHFKEKQTYLKIYEEKELLSHELCHVGRMMFQESKFEEILAYKTAKSSFRRFISPLVSSSMESVIFLLIIFTIALFDVFLIAMKNNEAYLMAIWLKTIPLSLFFLSLMRLWRRQNVLKKTILKLKEVVGKENALPVVYRLTDQEIISFSKKTPKEIETFIDLQSNLNPRMEVIKNSYFSLKTNF